jgi:TRAP-type C4-dicarboxylate transport system permease small subunit
MNTLKKVFNIFDTIINIFAFIAGLLIIFVIFSIVYEMISRHLLVKPTVWVVEIVEYSLLYITFLSTTWLLKNDGHVKMDIMLLQLNDRLQKIIKIVTISICSVSCLLLTIFGVRAVILSYEMGYKTATELEMPQYIILTVIPFGTCLLFLQFLKMLIMNIYKKAGH